MTDEAAATQSDGDKSKAGQASVEPAGASSPHLDEQQKDQAAAHAAPHALVIHEVVREEGEIELQRTTSALAWSGLAAGLSMGFSLLCLALLRAALPNAPWSDLLASPGYSVGFVIAILGRQQLFTESTLTGVLPLLVRRDAATLLALLRTWGVVLACNLVGSIAFAGLISLPAVFPDNVHHALAQVGSDILQGPTGPKIIRAVLAGWLIALMVWLLPSARSARLLVILLLTYVVAIGHFPHVVAGSADAAYAVFVGQADISDYLFHFLLPTLLGNTIGGVALVALLNHAAIAPELQS